MYNGLEMEVHDVTKSVHFHSTLYKQNVHLHLQKIIQAIIFIMPISTVNQQKASIFLKND